MRGLHGLSETMIGGEEGEDQTKNQEERLPRGGCSRGKGQAVCPEICG